MKKLLILFLSILLYTHGFSQEYQSEFSKYYAANDTINQLKILTQWENAHPKDSELFTSYFNYYFSKAKNEVLALTKEKPKGESLVLENALNETEGFIGSQVFFDQNELQKGLQKIDQGIALYPDRLDMRFGKIHVLGENSDWEGFTSEIVKAIQHSATNNNQWTWTNNKKREGGEKDFLLTVQTYQLQLYNTGNNELLENMRYIANEVLKYYPKHVESLTNISVTYLITNEIDKAIEVLLKAEKINPEDYIVLSNIAHAYTLKDEKDKAINYYKKVIEFGNDDIKKFAKQKIEELKN